MAQLIVCGAIAHWFSGNSKREDWLAGFERVGRVGMYNWYLRRDM